MSNKFTPILSSFGRGAMALCAGMACVVLFVPWTGSLIAVAGSLVLCFALTLLLMLFLAVVVWGIPGEDRSLSQVFRDFGKSEPKDDEPEISTREAYCKSSVMQERVRCARLAYAICESKGGSGRQLGTEIYSEIMKLGGE